MGDTEQSKEPTSVKTEEQKQPEKVDKEPPKSPSIDDILPFGNWLSSGKTWGTSFVQQAKEKVSLKEFKIVLISLIPF